jgi:hypothetical protein
VTAKSTYREFSDANLLRYVRFAAGPPKFASFNKASLLAAITADTLGELWYFFELADEPTLSLPPSGGAKRGLAGAMAPPNMCQQFFY